MSSMRSPLGLSGTFAYLSHQSRAGSQNFAIKCHDCSAWVEASVDMAQSPQNSYEFAAAHYRPEPNNVIKVDFT